MRSLYLRSLADAMIRPAPGEPAAALAAFLTLNAAYFLGEWLPAAAHATLVRRLAAELDGLADLPLPTDEPAASQLAQHARELTAAFGPSAWTERTAHLTEHLVPRRAEDWTAAMRPAIETVRDERPLAEDLSLPFLLAHARRRLWELTHPDETPAEAAPAPTWALRLVRRAAANGDGRAIQVAEALLAELALV